MAHNSSQRNSRPSPAGTGPARRTRPSLLLLSDQLRTVRPPPGAISHLYQDFGIYNISGRRQVRAGTDEGGDNVLLLYFCLPCIYEYIRATSLTEKVMVLNIKPYKPVWQMFLTVKYGQQHVPQAGQGQSPGRLAPFAAAQVQ